MCVCLFRGFFLYVGGFVLFVVGFFVVVVVVVVFGGGFGGGGNLLFVLFVLFIVSFCRGLGFLGKGIYSFSNHSVIISLCC